MPSATEANSAPSSRVVLLAEAAPLARHRAAQAAGGLALDEAPLELGLDDAARRARSASARPQRNATTAATGRDSSESTATTIR